MNTSLEDLEEKIGNIASRHCADYPDIENIPVYSKLWAIEQTLEGIDAANKDAHKMIKILAAKLGMSDLEVVALWEREIPLLEKQN